MCLRNMKDIQTAINFEENTSFLHKTNKHKVIFLSTTILTAYPWCLDFDQTSSLAGVGLNVSSHECTVNWLWISRGFLEYRKPRCGVWQLFGCHECST